MGKPYAKELLRLSDTLKWANSYDVTVLRKAVTATANVPLLVVGSGGSLSAAQLLVGLHRFRTGRVASIATPYEVNQGQIDPNTAVWLLSAGGRNVDIRSAFSTLVELEPKHFGIICGQSKSPLVAASRNHSFVDSINFDLPAGKDGFLATNSLLAFSALIARAYSEEFATSCPSILAEAKRLIDNDVLIEKWRQEVDPLWLRETTVILHGAHTRPGAVDLESKFTEAAIGNLQLSDYRNFAHGRHHWLAKKGSQTALLAFVTPEDMAIADRTLALIPNNIPVARINLQGSPEIVGLLSIIASLFVCGWAGKAREIDPGRPGVPEFGRKLYHLSSPQKHPKKSLGLTATEERIIERKSRTHISELVSRGDVGNWKQALQSFKKKLTKADFSAVILDYDGTLVDTRERFLPPRKEVMKEIIRLLRGNIVVAVATGRGESFRKDFRSGLPRELWKRVVVGYYNGAEIATLKDATVPDTSSKVSPILSPISQAFRDDPELSKISVQTDKCFQITLKAKGYVPEDRLWDIANQIVRSSGIEQLKILRSSHSIDIVAPGVSKLRVVESVRAQCKGEGQILAIGDRGRWPGNDFELLNQTYSLSVDETNSDLNFCWNISLMGQRGLASTLQYLKSLEITRPGRAKFNWASK
jgi:hypothetical protein